MQIMLNGQAKEISAGLNIQALVKQLNQETVAVVAEYNGRILQREDWAQTLIAENAQIELIKFCGGG